MGNTKRGFKGSSGPPVADAGDGEMANMTHLLTGRAARRLTAEGAEADGSIDERNPSNSQGFVDILPGG